jgi:protein involved in polysaccharide export with SLBB domain
LEKGVVDQIEMALNKPKLGKGDRAAARNCELSAYVRESGPRCSVFGATFISCLLACALCLGVSPTLAGKKKYPSPPPEFFQANRIGKPVVIARGDILSVRFYYEPKLNQTVRVRQDGKISLDLFQGIDVAGLEPEALQQKLTEMYVHELTNPGITVAVDSQANNAVYVTGEVLVPGAKEVHANMTVGMVLALSQVIHKNANPKSVFLIRATEDAKYRVYKLNASVPGGDGADVQVVPGDVYFVPRSGIVKADDFMEHYVRQLLPGSLSAATDVLFTPGSPLTTAAAATH